MKRFLSAARQASTSALVSGARRPRQIPLASAAQLSGSRPLTTNTYRSFGSGSAALHGNAEIKPEAGLAGDRLPSVHFDVNKDNKEMAEQDDNSGDDWFQTKDESSQEDGDQRSQQQGSDRGRNNGHRNRQGGGRHHAGRGRHAGGRGRGRGGRGRGRGHNRPSDFYTPPQKKEEPQPRPIATTSWICVQNIPPSSILEDVADCIARVMQREIDSGIIDLDKAEQFVEDQEVDVEGEKNEKETTPSPSMEELPFWDPSLHDASLNGSYIQEARLLLSVLGRPSGWYLRMPDRSCVQAILSHADEDANKGPGRRLAVSIGGRSLSVAEFDPTKGRVISGSFGSDTPLVERSFDRAVQLRLDDSVIRVENCPVRSAPEDMRYLFRRYDIIDTRRLRDNKGLDAAQLIVQGNYGRRNDGTPFYPDPNYHGENSDDIQPLRVDTPIATNTFIVRFETAADARAAIREMQMVEFEGRQLRLAQYPKQLLP